jgi:GNAT superfamily N-acetyltransferase
MLVIYSNGSFVIRQAEKSDSEMILTFIKDLAVYEKLIDEVSATEDLISEALFGDKIYAECLLGFEGEKPVAFALFFHNFSTFKGKPGLYLEDLYVKPEYRGKGYGGQMLSVLAAIALERNCERFEWSVLDWNEPAIKFYLSLGAKAMDEWTIFRISGESLRKLAANNSGND